MKKVKFMLLAIAVIAIAGGTLAFKAKFDTLLCTDVARFNGITYTCAIPAQEWTATCDETEVVRTQEFQDEPVTVCYTEAVGNECPEECTSTILGEVE